MRITIVQGAFFPVPPILGGAIEKTWHVLGREFAALGHQTVHLSRRHPALPQRETVDGVLHRRISGFDTVRNPVHLKLLDLVYTLRVRRALPPADILVSNTFWMPIVARDPNHGATYVHVARMPKGQMRFYGRAARLQGISSAVAEAIRAEVPHLAEKVKSIPLPLPWPVDGTPGPKDNTILYVGRIHPEKGLHLLLEAAAQVGARLPTWKLKIVGPSEVRLGGGGGEYLQELQRRAAELQVPVEWGDPIFAPDRLRAEYRAAAIFVYPSLAERGETFGLAPLEAMSSGCVPVVSDLACFSDFLRHNQNGLVFDHRAARPADELARQLSVLIEHVDLRGRLSEEALETARQFSAPAVARRYLDDFESVLRGTRLGR
jgi:glycosyltransferase involved in cell wall biosynthesis